MRTIIAKRHQLRRLPATGRLQLRMLEWCVAAMRRRRHKTSGLVQRRCAARSAQRHRGHLWRIHLHRIQRGEACEASWSAIWRAAEAPATCARCAQSCDAGDGSDHAIALLRPNDAGRRRTVRGFVEPNHLIDRLVPLPLLPRPHCTHVRRSTGRCAASIAPLASTPTARRPFTRWATCG